jgi:hypothetical protein
MMATTLLVVPRSMPMIFATGDSSETSLKFENFDAEPDPASRGPS